MTHVTSAIIISTTPSSAKCVCRESHLLYDSSARAENFSSHIISGLCVPLQQQMYTFMCLCKLCRGLTGWNIWRSCLLKWTLILRWRRRWRWIPSTTWRTFSNYLKLHQTGLHAVASSLHMYVHQVQWLVYRFYLRWSLLHRTLANYLLWRVVMSQLARMPSPFIGIMTDFNQVTFSFAITRSHLRLLLVVKDLCMYAGLVSYIPINTLQFCSLNASQHGCSLSKMCIYLYPYLDLCCLI